MSVERNWCSGWYCHLITMVLWQYIRAICCPRTNMMAFWQVCKFPIYHFAYASISAQGLAIEHAVTYVQIIFMVLHRTEMYHDGEKQTICTWSQWFNLFNSYSASHDNWCTAILWNRIMTAQCEGMGEVGSARYELALLPPCPSIRVLSYSDCQEIHSCQQTGLTV